MPDDPTWDDAAGRPTAAADLLAAAEAERDRLRAELEDERSRKCWKCGAKPTPPEGPGEW